ncbi:MAG TPA: fumarate hydratase [Patescibacteria group bacterium]|nr:fumarate hydratase [Patescibacteria group bacterium]
MRVIASSAIRDTVAVLCIQANLFLRKDVLGALKSAAKKETDGCARQLLRAIIDNAAAARKEKLAICQDTGLPCIFLQIGQDVHVVGDLHAAINQGVKIGYRQGSLRNSIVADPLGRGKPSYTPAVIHTEIVTGKQVRITVLPKGFGCENKSALEMFKPTAPLSQIKEFVLDTVKAAGPDACPPYVVGVGIGGSAEYASLLAKKALLKPLGGPKQKLEQELLKAINKLGIGPMGLGGKTTALGVSVRTHPTHIAGLPVAVNISCHALRSTTKTI